MKFQVHFKNANPLLCQLDDTDLARRYLTLLKQEYNENPRPLFRDQQLYTLDYFRSLAVKAEQQLGWSWVHDTYDLSTTTRMHKDIEQYLAQGYENIPEQHDELLHELHFGLHAVESGSRRDSWLQLEWYNDHGFNITADEYPAKLTLEFGDIRLQNPYVGHHPLYVYEQQDNINVGQTCRFHDFVKPGINLVIAHNTGKTKFDFDKYLTWFETNAPEFVQQHGIEQLTKFTGHPVVGHVINKNDLQDVIDQNTIQFDRIDFE
jgi:hypothetical protein